MCITLKLQCEVEEVPAATASERQHQRDRSKHCSTSDVYGDNDRLQQHCELLTEAYTRSFVIGAYNCIFATLLIDAIDGEG